MLGGPAGAAVGIGGGGGAPESGNGGGGGGADGAPEGGGGGGGGGAVGAPLDGTGGGGAGGGGAADSNALALFCESCTGVAGLLSMADIGRGGAIVPNKIEANCFADPPAGGSSSSSLEASSFSEPAADHESSSGRRRDCVPVKLAVRGLAASCCAILWNGLVECKSAAGGAGGENGCA